MGERSDHLGDRKLVPFYTIGAACNVLSLFGDVDNSLYSAISHKSKSEISCDIYVLFPS